MRLFGPNCPGAIGPLETTGFDEVCAKLDDAEFGIEEVEITDRAAFDALLARRRRAEGCWRPMDEAGSPEQG